MGFERVKARLLKCSVAMLTGPDGTRSVLSRPDHWAMPVQVGTTPTIAS